MTKQNQLFTHSTDPGSDELPGQAGLAEAHPVGQLAHPDPVLWLLPDVRDSAVLRPVQPEGFHQRGQPGG